MTASTFTPWYDYPITQGYSPTGHTGVDIGTPTGTPLTALFPGVIEDASHQAWGWQIVEDIPNGMGGVIREVLAHLDRVAVRAGQTVAPGQLLGLSGGENLPAKYSNGPHTHLGLYTGPVWQNQTASGQIETLNPVPLIQSLQAQSNSTGTAGTAGTGTGTGSVGTPLSFDPCAWLPDGPLKDACYANTFGGAGTTPGVGQPNGPNPLGGVEGLMALLTNPSTWLRVGGALLGLALIIVAVAAMLRKE